MKSKSMYYEPDNSEGIPLNKHGKQLESIPSRKKNKFSRVCFNLMIIAYIFCVVSLIIFLVFITLKLDKFMDFDNFFEIILPFFAFLLFGDLLCNKLIGIFNARSDVSSLGSFMLYFTHNSFFIFIFLFVLLLSFKLSDLMSLNFSFIFIPIDMIFAIMFLFVCFIFPGLMDKQNEMYQEAFLLVAYFCMTLITIIFLTVRLDSVIQWKYYEIFIGEFTLFVLHFLLILKHMITKKTNFDIELFKLACLVLVILGILLPALKVDEILDFSWFLIFIPIYVMTLFVVIQSSKYVFSTLSYSEEKNYE